jgi:hypothetical protein
MVCPNPAGGRPVCGFTGAGLFRNFEIMPAELDGPDAMGLAEVGSEAGPVFVVRPALPGSCG